MARTKTTDETWFSEEEYRKESTLLFNLRVGDTVIVDFSKDSRKDMELPEGKRIFIIYKIMNRAKNFFMIDITGQTYSVNKSQVDQLNKVLNPKKLPVVILEKPIVSGMKREKNVFKIMEAASKALEAAGFKDELKSYNRSARRCQSLVEIRELSSAYVDFI